MTLIACSLDVCVFCRPKVSNQKAVISFIYQGDRRINV